MVMEVEFVVKTLLMDCEGSFGRFLPLDEISLRFSSPYVGYVESSIILIFP